MPGRTLVPRRQGDRTDWSGRCLSKRLLGLLAPGCVVRVCVDNLQDGSAEALYFTITRMKDGTFWGTCEPTYRLADAVGLPTGSTFTFRKEHVNEVPVEWQPKWFRRAAARVDSARLRHGYFVTGYR